METINTATITTTNSLTTTNNVTIDTSKPYKVARTLVFYQDVIGGKLYKDFETDAFYFIPEVTMPSFFLNGIYTAAMKPAKKEIVDKVFFNERKGATCVCWKDGTKTVVKCQPEDDWNKMMGLALCFMKKAYNNKGNFNDFLRKWLKEGKEI